MATDSRDIFQYRTFCVITGASKGFGRTIAREFASRLPKASTLLLLARSADKLESVKREIDAQSPGIHVHIHPSDLAQAAGSDTVFRNVIENSLKSPDVESVDFQQVLVIHNAGSLGDISKNMMDLCDPGHLTSYWALNLTSVVTLNSVFFDVFKSCSNVSHRMAINISSICALQPFKSWSLYCAGMS